ncbi:hypothetical protein [Mariniluteicoccus flavus]
MAAFLDALADLLFPSGRKKAPRRRRRDRRLRNIFAITRHIPDSMTLDPGARGIEDLWADTVPPDGFGPGHFENRLEGFVGARRSSNAEPTRFVAFEHVDPEGWRQWYLMVPLRSPLPPLDVVREPHKADRRGDHDTGDAHFDRLYHVTGWDDDTDESRAYVSAILTPAVVRQMKEVAFAWRIRGRFLVSTPKVGDVPKAVAYAQNRGTQLALIADRIPDEVFARYAAWVPPVTTTSGPLANPHDLR